MTYTIRFDGASKGNPGLCGAGYVIYKDNDIVEKDCKFISINNTNNFAEYSALLLGIERAIELEIKNINIEGDSQLAINQINGIYQVNSKNILELYNRVIENLIYFDSFKFQHIKRDKNKLADILANNAIKEYRLENNL